MSVEYLDTNYVISKKELHGGNLASAPCTTVWLARKRPSERRQEGVVVVVVKKCTCTVVNVKDGDLGDGPNLEFIGAFHWNCPAAALLRCIHSSNDKKDHDIPHAPNSSNCLDVFRDAFHDNNRCISGRTVLSGMVDFSTGISELCLAVPVMMMMMMMARMMKNHRGQVAVLFLIWLALQWQSTTAFSSRAMLLGTRPRTSWLDPCGAGSSTSFCSRVLVNNICKGHTRIFSASQGDKTNDGGDTPPQVVGTSSSSSSLSDIANFGAHRRDPAWQERSQQLILVVDDDDDLRQAVGTYLNQEGYQVTTCASAEAALEWLENNNNNNNNNKDNNNNNKLPNLIVSDICMPGGMDGLEFLKRIRQNLDWLGLPLVLLTAKGQVGDRIAGYKAGADAYLPKPFAPAELISILDSLLARQARFSNQSVTLQDLQQQVSDIKALLQKGGAGAGVNGFVQATNVFLAPDERQTLQLLCQGLPNKEIAAQTFLSTRRVEQLLTSLYRKTGVSNRTELVRWAIRTGTVQL